MQVSATPLTPKAATDREQLHKAAQQFEAIFVRQMLAAAHQAKFDDGGLFSSQGMETFQSMQDERFAEIASKTGGLGFAKVIEAQLSKRLDAAPAPQAAKDS